MIRRSATPAGILPAAALLAAFLGRPGTASPLPFILDGEARGFYSTTSQRLDNRSHFSGLALDAAATLPLNRFEARVDIQAFAGRDFTTAQEPLRQAYVRFEGDDWDTGFGKLFLKWGRADILNPTDNLNHFDRTLPVQDPESSRRGEYAFRGRYFLGETTLEAVLMPFQMGSKDPGARSGDLPRRLPPYDGRHWSVAAKIDRHGHLGDASISYFDGYDPSPALALDPGPRLYFPRVGVLGADFALTLGRLAYRGESGWFRYRNAGGKQDKVFTVAGAEKTWRGQWTTALQGIHYHILGFRGRPSAADGSLPALRMDQAQEMRDVFNGQADRETLGMSLRVAKPLRNDDLQVSAIGVANLTRGDVFLQSKARYAWGAGWRTEAKVDLYRGKEMSLFGRLQKNSGIAIDLARFF